MPPSETAVHPGGVPALLVARRAMFERFMALMAPTPDSTVIDLGVTDETGSPEANYFEQWYLPARVHRSVLSAVGMEYWASEDHLNLLSNLIAHEPARADR
jgi:hypothetical protein